MLNEREAFWGGTFLVRLPAHMTHEMTRALPCSRKHHVPVKIIHRPLDSQCGAARDSGNFFLFPTNNFPKPAAPGAWGLFLSPLHGLEPPGSELTSVPHREAALGGRRAGGLDTWALGPREELGCSVPTCRLLGARPRRGHQWLCLPGPDEGLWAPWQTSGPRAGSSAWLDRATPVIRGSPLPAPTSSVMAKCLGSAGTRPKKGARCSRAPCRRPWVD